MPTEERNDGERRRSPRHLRLRLSGTLAEVTDGIERTLADMAYDDENEYVVYVPLPEDAADDVVDRLPDGVGGDVVDGPLTPLDRKSGGRKGSNGPSEVEP